MEANLPKIVKPRKKRIGRGYGSGRGGHTVGRGQKGQKARSKNPLLFEGTKIKKSLFKRLPLRRGKGKMKKQRKSPLIIKLSLLNVFPEGSTVSIESLVSYNIVKKDEATLCGVKVLGDGELTKKLTVKVPTSRSVAKRIEKAGGKVVVE